MKDIVIKEEYLNFINDLPYEQRAATLFAVCEYICYGQKPKKDATYIAKWICEKIEYKKKRAEARKKGSKKSSKNEQLFDQKISTINEAKNEKNEQLFDQKISTINEAKNEKNEQLFDQKISTINEAKNEILQNPDFLRKEKEPKRKEDINNKEKKIYKKKESEKFKKPQIEEIKKYCEQRQNNIDPMQFYDFYQSKDWFVGKNKMKDWQAAIRTWERNSKKQNYGNTKIEQPKPYTRIQELGDTKFSLE